MKFWIRQNCDTLFCFVCLLLSSRTLVGPSLPSPPPPQPIIIIIVIIIVVDAFCIDTIFSSSSPTLLIRSLSTNSCNCCWSFSCGKFSNAKAFSAFFFFFFFFFCFFWYRVCFLWEIPHSSSARKLPLLSLSICFVQLRRRGSSPSPRFALFSENFFLFCNSCCWWLILENFLFEGLENMGAAKVAAPVWRRSRRSSR